MALIVILNGRSEQFDELDEGATLSQAIDLLGLKADRVAVERNGEIVGRALWATVELSSGDKLEVVHFVGGGTAEVAR
jgi:sulfur carrier protein